MKKEAFDASGVVVAIDVGTTKICTIIAKSDGKGGAEVLGVGTSPSVGLKKGVVVDVAKSVKSIQDAVDEAQFMAGLTVESAHIGVSGGHISSLSSQGVVPVKRGEIRQSDVDLVINAAKAVPIADGQRVLHVIPQFFTVDGGDRVLDPVGMYGVRLEAQVHIVTGSIASVQNLVKCCEMAGVKVKDIVLEQLASSDSVLSDDERELGVSVLDIGGGTSDFAVYHGGSIRHTMVIPVAGNHFNNDVAVGMRTTIKDAERVKMELGISTPEFVKENPELLVEGVHGGQQVVSDSARLRKILHARAKELLVIVKKDLDKHQLWPFIPAGLVITGGGSLLKGMDDLARSTIGLPVRIGNPRQGFGLPQSLSSPIYATVHGLLIHAMKKGYIPSMSSGGLLLGHVFSRMKSWVADLF